MLHSLCPALTVRTFNRQRKVLRKAQNLPEFQALSLSCISTPCTALGELPPPTNSYCYSNSLLLAAAPCRIGPSISVFSLETSRSNNIAGRCCNDAESERCKFMNETLLLWLVSSLWAEILNAELLHHVGTAKRSAGDREPGACR